MPFHLTFSRRMFITAFWEKGVGEKLKPDLIGRFLIPSKFKFMTLVNGKTYKQV